MTFWVIASAVGTVWVAINGVLIVLQRRPAASTIAWLLVLVFLPVLGLVLYRLIGPLKLERRKRRRVVARRVVDEGARGLAALAHESEHHQLAMVSIGLGGAPPLRAETVDLYFDGVATYAAILEAVAAAQHHVHLEYYIWEPDHIGTTLRDLLVERAKAGVAVRLLLDGTGSSHIRTKFLRPLRQAGVKIAWFNPVRLFQLRRRRIDFRSHRKIVVCDGRVGFTGGMNITDVHSAALAPDTYWRDTHLRLTGAAVWPIQRIFMEDWYFAAEEPVPFTAETVPPPQKDGEHLVQIVESGPDATTFAIHKTYFTAINQATRRCWLTTPYFVPDDALLTALIGASLRGVDVRVLIPRKGDSFVVDLAARSYVPELLDAKIRVFEYTARFIHAKTMACDEDVAIVGTANFDNRSFRLDFELIALLYGRSANADLAAAFERDCADAREITHDTFAKQSFPRRFGEATARLLSPLL